MNLFGKIKAFFTIDLRDIFVFGGLAIMSYGLYLFRPWVAYTIGGLILMALGLFLGRHK